MTKNTDDPPAEDDSPAASDIKAQAWVVRVAPEAFRPYSMLARLDRPVGIWLLLLPCLWSLTLAGNASVLLVSTILFIIGATVMRGAGCTINDIIDRDIDAQVARTQTRPIPAGDVSLVQAFGFLAVQCLIGLLVLLQFNDFTIMLGASALVLVALYPFMKRITYWPQAFLGLTFNWGALVGWASVYGELSAAPLFLYAAGLFWTLGYDTIYAHQDKDDDAMIGVKSTALKLGDHTKFWLMGFYGVTIVLLGQAIDLSPLSGWAYLALLFGSLHLGWQLYRLDIHDSKRCLDLFKSNRDFGLLVLLGLLAGLIS